MAFKNSNAGVPGANPNQTAGALWPALADFDDTIRKLSAAPAPTRPASFERRLLRDRPQVFEFPFASCDALIMVAALPAASGSLLISDTLIRGVTEIAQYSADGKQKQSVLARADRSGFVLHRLAAAGPGPYRIRWTFNHASYREAVVWGDSKPAA